MSLHKAFQVSCILVWIIIACGCSVATPVYPVAGIQKIMDGYYDVAEAYDHKIVLEQHKKDGPSDFFLFDFESHKMEATKFGAYSPDGKILAICESYSSGLVSGNWVFMDITTGTTLGRINTEGNLLMWKPDGTQVAYLQSQGNQIMIHFIDTKTWKEVRLITLDDKLPVKPMITSEKWSPDGTRIAFSIDQRDPAAQFGRSALYIVDLSSEQVSMVANDPNFDLSNPAWSPNSDVIAMRASPIKRAFETYLAFVDLKTGCLQIYRDLRIDYSFVWLSDGSQIVYALNDIYSVDVDTIPDRYHVPGKMCGVEGTPSPTPSK